MGLHKSKEFFSSLDAYGRVFTMSRLNTELTNIVQAANRGAD